MMDRGLRPGVWLAVCAFFSTLAAPIAYADVPIPRIAPRAGVEVASIGPATARPASFKDALRGELGADVSLSVERFYAARDYTPLWTPERTAALEKTLADAPAAGLDPRDYKLHAMRPGLLGAARHELMLTETALRYARHAHSGRLRPSDVGKLVNGNPPRLNESLVLYAIDRDGPAAALDATHPQHPQYVALRAALAEALAAETETVEIPKIGAGRNLRLGSDDPRVVILRERLNVPAAPAETLTVFDERLRAAVRAIQRDNGLRADGIVGPQTQRALDGERTVDPVPVLIANLERWRWLPRDLGSRHVRVNIPAFRVRVVANGKTTWDDRVVVGTPFNPTPIFSDEMEHVVVNPYWNVPYSIAKNEMLGSLRKNPSGFTRRNNYEVVMNGRVVNPASVQWSASQLRRVRIRQRPGRGNALGRVKFLFPNRYAVYLHDTPSRHLFQRSRRAYSHGCVRVHRPLEFAAALLEGEPSLSGERVRRMVGGQQRWLNLEHKIPVHLTYFTAEVGDTGQLQLHADVYGIDRKLLNRLNKRYPGATI